MHPLMVSYFPWLDRAGESLFFLVKHLGGLGIMLVAIADSSFLTLPETNDLIIVVLSAGSTWTKMVFYVGITILGSMSGCLLLYSLGRKGGSPMLRKRFSETRIRRAEELYARYGILTIVIPSILPPPCPFKIFVLSAGAFQLNWLKFILAVALGRTIRYSFWGILAVLYGDPVRLYMQQNLQRVGIMLFFLFAIGVGTLIVSYLIRLYRAGRQSAGA